MADGNGYTPIQRKMLDILKDGEAHHPLELHKCLADELGPRSNIGAHLTALREKLRPKGINIALIYDRRRLLYQLVRRVQGDEVTS